MGEIFGGLLDPDGPWPEAWYEVRLYGTMPLGKKPPTDIAEVLDWIAQDGVFAVQTQVVVSRRHLPPGTEEAAIQSWIARNTAETTQRPPDTEDPEDYSGSGAFFPPPKPPDPRDPEDYSGALFRRKKRK